MGNVSIIIADKASPQQMAENGLAPHDVLYGLYDGVPLPERGSYVPPLPDVITIFQEPIERASRSMEELEEQVVTTVRHEVAHYFGFSDNELDKMGLG
ncbi:MAG: metallopeptidase family protein [Chloroflexi bacterium]|nr:metallopeptidase family protein [Chloroflexota bacterium]